jgi:hypothetical protein
MQALSRVFQSVQRALRVFFSHDIRLRRRGKGVALTLDSRPASATGTPRPARHDAAQRESDDLQLMLRQLGEVLCALPDTRRRCRHLVFVEHALDNKGLRALHTLPVEVLEVALAQLENLVINWGPVGLANLRSKMAVAIIDRQHMDPHAEADVYNTAMPLDTPEAMASMPPEPGAADMADDRALAAAYAALGTAATPTPALMPMEMQGELASPSGKAVTRAAGRIAGSMPEIKLRELQG